MDEIKKVLLFGVGAVASTYEKSVEVIDDLVKNGNITVEEGKELGEELKRTFNDKCKTEGKNKYYETNGTNIEAYNYVTRDEFEILKARVYKLESKLNNEE